MCSATDTYDIALAADGVDIVESMFDYDGVDPDAKGMYGHHVHEAVLAAGETHTGITIHLVNEEFDKGEKIYQDQFEIPANATVSDVEQLIHQLEHKGMPIAVEQFLKRL